MIAAVDVMPDCKLPYLHRHDGNIAGVPPGGKAKGKGKPGRGKGKQGKAAPELTCKVCGLSFESRTQLFKHITATGHAALKR